MDLSKLKESWDNTFYRSTIVYICVIVTLMFAFQMYSYFVTFPNGSIKCVLIVSDSLHAIPWIGMWLHG